MSEFDKHWDTHCISSNCEEDEAKIHFEAGQQSQQAEVDELQLKLSEDSRVLHNVIDIERRKCEELQARIDEALRFYNEAKSPHNIGMMQMAIYLKGNKDESE